MVGHEIPGCRYMDVVNDKGYLDEDASTKVRMNGRESRAFKVNAKLHQRLSSQPASIHYFAGGFVWRIQGRLTYQIVLIAETKKFITGEGEKMERGNGEEGSVSECQRYNNHGSG